MRDTEIIPGTVLILEDLILSETIEVTGEGEMDSMMGRIRDRDRDAIGKDLAQGLEVKRRDATTAEPGHFVREGEKKTKDITKEKEQIHRCNKW